MEGRRKKFGIAILALALVIAVLDAVAHIYSLYWSIAWYDMLMHFLGGLFIGSSIGWLVSFEVPIGLRHKVPLFFIVVGGVLVVALLWEVFEFITGVSQAVGYVRDTLEDIAFGLLGGIVAYGIFKK